MIAGTIPALLTPFTGRGAEVDLDLMDAHVTWLHERGVRTISPMGTTGEGPSLSLAERKAVIDLLAVHPTGMRLLVGTGCTSLPETIELSTYAVERGAAGLLVAPPWYFDTTTRGTTGYYLRLLEALPPEARVFLYHIPSMTGVPIEDETLHELTARYGPMVAGTKDSSGDLDHVRRWLRELPGLTVLSGSDAFAAAVYEAGGRGTITLLANVFPEELEAIRVGDDAERRQAYLTEVRELVGRYPRHAALKLLLHLVSGLERASVRPPLDELTGEEAERFRTEFETLRSEANV